VKTGPSGQELKYEPDFFRWFATVLDFVIIAITLCIILPIFKVLLIVVVEGRCWLFLKYYDAAHSSRRGVSHYESPTIPNWPHLKEMESAKDKYDCVEVRYPVTFYLW